MKALRRLLWAAALGLAPALLAQVDPLQAANQALGKATHNVFSFTLEERTRWEEKDGVNFGKAVNQQDMLSRVRIGAWIQPLPWLSFYAMGQDGRAPYYGVPAPTTARESMDLQEGYVEFFAQSKTGFGARVGRQMLDFGESRLLGSGHWTNITRTYDIARVYYRTAKARVEILMVSPVHVQSDSFNKPEWGDRIWGTYDTTATGWHGSSVDVYALRHSQNKIGGWTGAGTLGTNTFGSRFYGPLPAHFGYSLEGVGQTGHLGLLTQRAFAWYTSLSRKWSWKDHDVAWLVEYKGASGTRLGAANSATFDQLSPANHDKFGHMDLFGWRNLKTVKSLATFSVTKTVAWNLMYNDHRLYSPADSLYNSTGSSIALSKTGAAGTHVGQELDTFVTWKRGGQTIGAGFGHFFRGGFIDLTTPHINPRYFYVFQQYAIKKAK